MTDTRPLPRPEPLPHPEPKIISFGCRLNIAESEAIRAQVADMEQDRPLIVINGCAVTGEAMRQARASVRKVRRDQPDARIIVTGCAAQVDPARFAAMPEVDRVLGNAEKLASSSYAFVDDAAPRIMVADVMALTRTAPQMIPAFVEHARGFLEVQNGCDHRCTFCIIPYGRGPSRSVPLASAVTAAAKLTDAGHQELVLTGVDLTSYGHDLPGAPTLATLIRTLLDAVPAIARLRLGSIDVAEIDDPLFDLLTGEPRMMPHVHLSLQAGDDLILKRMKRRHSRAQAVAMVERLKGARPAIAIGADLIAGFPTEDDAAAANSRALIADCAIVHPHIFPYSPRDGTPAARMPQLDRPLVKSRAAALRAVADAARTTWLTSLIGTRQTMLVERDGQSGHADNFARISLTHPAKVGNIIAADIIGLDGTRLIGKEAA
jgi:threonylcarbamoyladenosine tRNA methylthiotransferase MtaB